MNKLHNKFLVDNKAMHSIILLPSIDEIASEWDQNVISRAKELENGEDFTYKNVLIPNIKFTLETYANFSDEIIDVGCGIGYLTNSVSKWGYRVMGIDVSTKSIEYASSKFKHINFVNTSIEKFSQVSKEEFDICIANMVLHNVFDLEKTIAAINMTLKIGGIAIVTIPNPDVWIYKDKLDLRLIENLQKESIYKASFKIRSGNKHPSPFTYFHRAIDRYNAKIIDAGFKILNSTYPIILGNGEDEDIIICVWEKVN